jgi:methyl coenzyme M reductase subunit D
MQIVRLDDHVRLRRYTGDAAESDATERRQSGRLSLPRERQQIAGPTEHCVRHEQEERTNQIRRVAEGIFPFFFTVYLSLAFCSRAQEIIQAVRFGESLHFDRRKVYLY